MRIFAGVPEGGESNTINFYTYIQILNKEDVFISYK